MRSAKRTCTLSMRSSSLGITPVSVRHVGFPRGDRLSGPSRFHGCGGTTTSQQPREFCGTFKSPAARSRFGAVTDASSKTYRPSSQRHQRRRRSFPSPADLDGNNSRSTEVWVGQPPPSTTLRKTCSLGPRAATPNGSTVLQATEATCVGAWGGTGYEPAVDQLWLPGDGPRRCAHRPTPGTTGLHLRWH